MSGPVEVPRLAGRTVVLTRSSDRAAAMLAALKAEGARPLLLPLIDFEVPADPEPLDRGLASLAGGKFGWLVVTSITTVRALKARALAGQTTVRALVPASTRVAAVGPTTRRALEAEGVSVDLVPAGDQSAAGLLEVWPPAPGARATADGVSGDVAPAGAGREGGTVFLPQADIASGTLSEGLALRGWCPTAAVAYHTVDYPAREERRLGAELELARSSSSGAAASTQAGSDPEILSPAAFSGLVDAGAIDAVVATSPSAVRRLIEVAGPSLVAVGHRPDANEAADSRPALIAIGHSTAEQAANLGLMVAAVAASPTAAGISAAVVVALTRIAPPSSSR